MLQYLNSGIAFMYQALAELGHREKYKNARSRKIKRRARTEYEHTARMDDGTVVRAVHVPGLPPSAARQELIVVDKQRR